MSDIEQWTGQERILLNEIDRLRARVAELRASQRREYIEALEDRAEKSEAAIARVRALCASYAGDDDILRASVLAALEGEQA